ncbi:uncharacterized protein SOCE26_067080 [Sorangium cellulosum]|uniref:Uncharacterized protein n=1 Tax=Sorangium cellulosum TaxID=56 RepID=A0A2L0F117_SORCE|nr:uncharacterized protein SOCE26_067080 [Sorangium cellulosum]
MLTDCTVETTPRHGETGESETEEENEGVLRTFDVQLSSDTTEETVIPRIVAAGREEIAAACASTSGAAIRVFNPLALGDYSDVPCSAILNDIGEACSAPTSDPNDNGTGEAQQRLSPFSLGCADFVGGSALVSQFLLCPRATTERDRRRCDYWTGGGFFGLGLMCAAF